MIDFFWAGIGTAIGGGLRGGLSALNKKKFPIGTFLANMIGSLLIGIFMAISLNQKMDNYTHVFLITGFCGGLTTFSTFSFETIELFLYKENKKGTLYWVTSLGSSLLLVSIAFFCTKSLLYT